MAGPRPEPIGGYVGGLYPGCRTIVGFGEKTLLPSASEVSQAVWDAVGFGWDSAAFGGIPTRSRSLVLVVDLLALGLDAGRGGAVVGGRRRRGGIVAVAGAAGISRAVALLAGGEARGNED